MRKYFFGIMAMLLVIACNDSPPKQEAAKAAPDEKPTVDLPYKASYSSSWTQEVSDVDLKMVLQTYKDWETGNISAVVAAFGDTLTWDMADGTRKKLTHAEASKTMGAFRDSLSSVRIDMGAWNKMHSTDKKSDVIVTWYDEFDT
ncbi:MAG: hypothetical protein HYX40_03940, partial [Sphingobacteriales bacterium]|nr:hypothetical protein [Sphingobacteriales bacterium]